MATTSEEKKRVVLVAIDNSNYAAEAFQCKCACFVLFGFVLFCFSSFLQLSISSKHRKKG